MLLTIDIGTSSFKSALWDYNGKRLSFVSYPLSIDVSNGKYEADPSQWLLAFEQCCPRNEVSNKQLGKLDQVDAIVISGNGPTLVPVLADNLPTPNARLWLDRRAEKYQREVSDVMGGFVDACFFLPKILYIKNDEKELYDKTKCFLGCPEYLAYALTDVARNVFPSEGFDRWFWNDDILKKLKLDASKFPVFIRPGDLFGTITDKTAAKFGFKKNIPVISGGPDFYASILGSGVVSPGQVCDRTGSSDGINLCTTEKYLNDAQVTSLRVANDSLNSLQRKSRLHLMSYAHPIKPHWNLSSVINTTGKAIDWACKFLNINSFDDFMTLAKNSKPGSGGLIFIPSLAGERASNDTSRNPQLNGASWSGISLSTERSEAANSVLEGIGFAIKNVLSVMEETGERAEQLYVTGGLAGCDTLNQIKADITGLEVLMSEHKECELLGLAIIGSCFMGKYSSFAEASKEFCKVKKRYMPNQKNKDIYDELFGNFLTPRRTEGLRHRDTEEEL